MILTVTSHGSSLRRRGECIEAKTDSGSLQRFPICMLEAVLLTCSCSVSTDVMTLCAEHDVPVTMLDHHGVPVWRTETFEGGSTPLLHRKQLELAHCAAGTELIKTLLGRKLKNCSDHLIRLAVNRRDERKKLLSEKSDKILTFAAKIECTKNAPISDVRGTLLGYEGSAGRIYFSALESLLPPEAEFSGRAGGAGDGAFNRMLNYGYGVLYQELLRLCIKARLDPYLGVMHTDGYSRPALTFDLIEPFRTAAEQTVCKLFFRRQVRADEHFTQVDDGSKIILSGQGKRLLMDELSVVMKKKYSSEMARLVSGLAKGLADWKR